MKFPNVPESAGSGSKNFLKFKDKESITLVVVGDPVAYHAVWQNDRYERCAPETPKASIRFRVNVVYKDDESKQTVSKIWEGGMRLLKQLEELHQEFDLDTIYLKVTRRGTGKETAYSLMPANQKRTETTNKAIAQVALQSLGVDEQTAAAGASFDDSDIPF